ncbi:MAG TPA: GntR family transcriptional regulator [Verrucomicrobiota bacterium]|nr:GntR family transcriptional regulator [Verrucomicrobiota bacterium]
METLLPEKVYQYLKQGLLAGEFLPGVRLEYQRLASQLGVSTTPVREAMSKLASEGLIRLVPCLGAVVRSVDQDELAQLHGVREAIEPYAAALAAGKISAGTKEQLRFLVERMEQLLTEAGQNADGLLKGRPLAHFLQCDRAFHMTITEASGNPRLVKIAADIAARPSIFGGRHRGFSVQSLRTANRTHRSILRAMDQRDAARARMLVLQHIQHSLELELAAATPQATRTCALDSFALAGNSA